MKYSLLVALYEQLSGTTKRLEKTYHIAEFLKDNQKVGEEEIHNQLYEIAKASGIEPKDFFRSAYRFFIGKERGPKLANLILTAGKEKVLDVLSCI